MAPRNRLVCRRTYRWKWSDEQGADDLAGDEQATYSKTEKLTTIRQTLRTRHLLFWEALGHEFVHTFFDHTGDDAEGEQVALAHEKRVGKILHDLWKSGVIDSVSVCKKAGGPGTRRRSRPKSPR